VVGMVALATACGLASESGSVDPSRIPTATASGKVPDGLEANWRCRNEVEWCSSRYEDVPASLARRLRIPELDRGACPTTPGRRYDNGQFSGIALGDGPVQPLIAPGRRSDVRDVLKGNLTFDRLPMTQDYRVKTLWFARPSYQGPVLLRGTELGGSHQTRFGEDGSLVDPLLSAGPTTNGEHGFREWPGATWVRAPGCYTWQVDGTTFSEVIVFEAILRGSG
jgi:hypothetical protein